MSPREHDAGTYMHMKSMIVLKLPQSSDTNASHSTEGNPTTHEEFGIPM